jgi:pimeloyl-ACP methyl ester carboxylesterase
MDALYGVTFKLENIPDSVREHIDDFFGPMNFETVSQVIYFATNTQITDHTGRVGFVDEGAVDVEKCFPFPILHLQGRDNGLVDIETAHRFAEKFGDFGGFRSRRIPGMGHQDCLIGRDAAQVFGEIAAFLNHSKG